MVWCNTSALLDLLKEMDDFSDSGTGAVHPDFIVAQTYGHKEDPLGACIELLEKIKRDRDTYPVDANNPLLKRTAAQKKMGDGFLKVAVKGILRNVFDSVKPRLEVYYDCNFEAILDAKIVPRRNGKTTETSIDVLGILENVPDYTADVSANSKEQAGIMLDMTKTMARAKFGESSYFLQERRNHIVFNHPKGKSIFKSRPMNTTVIFYALFATPHLISWGWRCCL